MPLDAINPITTPRLELRQVCAQDLPDLMAVNGDPKVTCFLPYAAWTTAEDSVAWLARMEGLASSGSARQLVIVRRDDSRVLGTALLFRFDEGSSRVELGYVLGRAFWQQGYAKEALSVLLSHVFQALGLRRVEAEVNPDNTASNALLRSLGFTHEGYLRERWVAKGQTYGVNVYGLLACEWPADQMTGRQAR